MKSKKKEKKTCKKCQGPMHGHVGPHGDLCRNPSPQFFLGDAPELADIQDDLEESIRVHQQQINNLTFELQLLNKGSSTLCSDVLPSQHPAQGQGDFHPLLSSFRPTSSALCSTWSPGFGLSRPAAPLPVS